MVKVRYYSEMGHTKKIAEAIAKGANTDAISIEDEPKLLEYTDILILGGAPYANVMAKELREYALNLDKKLIGKVVLFTTSNWSRRTVRGLKEILKGKDIPFEKEYFYSQMFMVNGKIESAIEFGKQFKK